MINITKVKKVLREIVAENPENTAVCYYSVEGADWRARREEWWRKTVKEVSYTDLPELEDYPEPQPELVTPVCIVGQVVRRLNGVEGLTQLSEGDTADGMMNRPTLEDLGYSKNAIEFLAAVQHKQDSGYNWEDSLNQAESES